VGERAVAGVAGRGWGPWWWVDLHPRDLPGGRMVSHRYLLPLCFAAGLWSLRPARRPGGIHL